MTIYVDELPKSCDECPCFYDESISCQASDKWLPLDEEDNFSRSTQRHPTCPLKSLAEHDKQVRKEVCEEIKDLAGNYFELPYCDNCGETLFASSDVVLTGSDLTEILKQIQGDKVE